MGSAVTRRSFLRRSAAVAAAFAAAGFAGSDLLRAAGRAGGLSPARRRTYIALVDAVGRASRSQIDPARAMEAADWLDRYRTRALAPTGAGIDHVLDRLEREPAGRPFSKLDPDRRVAVLRALADGDGDGDLAGRAVALAAAPFHPPASEYHPTPVML